MFIIKAGIKGIDYSIHKILIIYCTLPNISLEVFALVKQAGYYHKELSSIICQ